MVRPDSSCGDCVYSYVGRGYGCRVFDAPTKFYRDIQQKVFIECVKLRPANPETPCAQCGDCCRAWALYASDSSKPKKPEYSNPCTKLNPDGTCSIYDSETFNKICRPFPDGGETGLFNLWIAGEIDATKPKNRYSVPSCPNCVYEVAREP